MQEFSGPPVQVNSMTGYYNGLKSTIAWKNITVNITNNSTLVTWLENKTIVDLKIFIILGSIHVKNNGILYLSVDTAFEKQQ